MHLDLFCDYFITDKSRRRLKTATFIMFLVLAAEKILSGTTAAYKGGVVDFYFSLTLLDIACVLIYISTAFLIRARVKYEYLVIPDFFLLAIKLCVIASEAVFLLTERNAAVTEKFSAAEHIIESVLFATFLICMFVGELSHGRHMPNFSSVCMNLLAICFPVTVLLETAKMIMAYEGHQNLYVAAFNFVKNVLSEAFLDVPYFLLILMVCLTTNKKEQTEE